MVRIKNSAEFSYVFFSGAFYMIFFTGGNGGLTLDEEESDGMEFGE